MAIHLFTGFTHRVFQGHAKKKLARRVPLTVDEFADKIPLYSHTPDGMTYSKAVEHRLIFVDLFTGKSDIVNPASEPGRQFLRREIDSLDAPQMVFSRNTTTVVATDLYSRNESVSYIIYCNVYCEFVKNNE